MLSATGIICCENPAEKQERPRNEDMVVDELADTSELAENKSSNL